MELYFHPSQSMIYPTRQHKSPPPPPLAYIFTWTYTQQLDSYHHPPWFDFSLHLWLTWLLAPFSNDYTLCRMLNNTNQGESSLACIVYISKINYIELFLSHLGIKVNMNLFEWKLLSDFRINIFYDLFPLLLFLFYSIYYYIYFKGKNNIILILRRQGIYIFIGESYLGYANSL